MTAGRAPRNPSPARQSLPPWRVLCGGTCGRPVHVRFAVRLLWWDGTLLTGCRPCMTQVADTDPEAVMEP